MLSRKKHGLGKTEIIRGKREFASLFSAGKRTKCGNLLFIYLPSTVTRAGFIASKKIGGAVKRNKVKRIIREAYRMNKQLFGGYNVLLYALDAVDAKAVQAAFKNFAERANKQAAGDTG